MSDPIQAQAWCVSDGFDVRTVADDRFVASVFGAGTGQKLARARLIAAAPDLLASLRTLLSGAPLTASDLANAQVAVAKAEGRS